MTYPTNAELVFAEWKSVLNVAQSCVGLLNAAGESDAAEDMATALRASSDRLETAFCQPQRIN